MDTVNLSDTQSTPLNCKSNACTRNPAGCASCGLNDYPKNIPPAYCFTTLYPGIPSCTHCQDHLPDNFAIPHSYFPSFPFQQQLFHSALIPPNYYCSQKLLNEEGTRHGQSNSEHETLHRHEKKERSAFKGIKNTKREGGQKNNQNLRSETSLPYFNEMECQFNSAVQRCVCGDSVPRPCSPLIMPVFSYCLVWNSQTPCQNLLSKNYGNYLTETLCQKNSENIGDGIYSSSNESPEKLNMVKEPAMVKTTSESSHKPPEVARCEKESLPVRKLGETDLKKAEQTTKNGDLNREISTTALPSDEVKSHEENSSKSTEQEEVTEYLDNISDDSDEEEEISEDEPESGDDVEMKEQTDSEESLVHDEKDAANGSHLPEKANPWKSGEYDATLERHSSSDFKSTAKSSDLSVVDSLSENQTNVWPAGAFETNRETVSNEASEERNSDDEEADTSKTNFKKCLKNFTVTNEIGGNEEEQKSTAAAGDLGGEGCPDKITKISKPNESKPENPPKEKCESSEFPTTNTGNEERKQEKVPEKKSNESLDENQNSGQKYKSGIAKLLHIPNSKALKTNALKITKNCKNESNQKQSSVVKHKHCCFPSDSINSSLENRYKIQKTTAQRSSQRPPLSSEKRQKSPSGSQSFKKGTLSQKTFRTNSGLKTAERP